MKALSVHLDRLEKVLKAHGVSCKRHQTLEIAAAAFGYHNQNQLAAAGKAGNLNPPLAEPVGEVTLPTGETVIIVRDPLANSPYAVDQAFVEQVVSEDRAERFGPTPYGHLLDLSRLLDDPIGSLQASVDGLDPDATIEIPLHIAEVQHRHGNDLYVMASQEALDAEVAEYCRASLLNDRALADHGSFENCADLGKLSDREIIDRYFDAPHEEYLNTSTETLNLPVSALREILGVRGNAQSSAPNRKTQTTPTPTRRPDTAHPDAAQIIANAESVWDDHPDFPAED